VRERAFERIGLAVGMLSIAFWALPSGCYLSHERAREIGDGGAPDVVVLDGGRDAGSAPVDAGPTCQFAFTAGGVRVSCEISAGSTEACLEAALCVCRGELRSATDSELLACAWWELTPRGAITLADFCAIEPPASTAMDEALAGYLVGRSGNADPETSPGCAFVPALIGPSPIEPCGRTAQRVCECVPGCDLDASLGTECLALGTEHAACILQAVVAAPDCSFVGDLPAIVRACE
jgi:hypothetical protein